MEINQIKDVLPVSDNIRRRLSQLQVMALCNSYIAKSNCFLNALSANDEQNYDECAFFDFSEALPGFLLAITSDGKLLYISDNVTEYLGHSMVELMTQAETIYDIIDLSDQTILREFLVSAKIKHDTVRDESRDELDFTCRVNLGRLFRRNNVFDRQKMIKIHGRFIWPEGELHLAEPIFVARCSPVLSSFSTEQPTVMDTTIFQTCHSLDMKYTNIEENGEFYTGYQKIELIGASWYQFIHPDDTQEACRKHTELIQGGLDTPRSLIVRLQTRYGSYIWIHVVMYLGNSVNGPLGVECNQQEIVCLNHVLDERDAMETRRRENLDLLIQNNQFHNGGMFGPNLVVQDSCIPTVVVDERFIEPMSSSSHHLQVKQSIPRDHQELMERLKEIAMENKNKKPRLDDSKSSTFHSINNGGQISTGLESLVNGDTRGLIGSPNVQDFQTRHLGERFGLSAPLTPPYSDDGRYDQLPSPASSYSPRAAPMAYTPPYSPPNSLDDASLFDAVQQSRKMFNGKSSTMKQERSAMGTGYVCYLPELDESAVENFFQDVECKDDLISQLCNKQILDSQFLMENNYLAEAILEEVSRQSNLGLELEEELSNHGPLMHVTSNNTYGMTNNGYSNANLLSTAAYGEESFLNMIDSPLALKTVDSSTLQILNPDQMII